MTDWLRRPGADAIYPDRHEPAMLAALDLIGLQLRGQKDAVVDQVEAMDTERLRLVLGAAIGFLADDMRTVAALAGKAPERLLADLRQEIVRRFAEVRLIHSKAGDQDA